MHPCPGLHANAAEAGIIHLDTEHALNWTAEHQAQNHARDTSVPDNQHTLARLFGTNISPGADTRA